MATASSTIAVEGRDGFAHDVNRAQLRQAHVGDDAGRQSVNRGDGLPNRRRDTRRDRLNSSQPRQRDLHR